MSNNLMIVRGERLVSLSPFVVAGIINTTPDSFSDGGLYYQAGSAFAHALELWGEGAGILDIGGESTRPGSNFVDAATEWQRLKPVLEGLAKVRELRRKQADAPLDEISRLYFTAPHKQDEPWPPEGDTPAKAASAPSASLAAKSWADDNEQKCPVQGRDSEKHDCAGTCLVPSGELPLVSVDTWRAVTAQSALELGVEIINDISGAVFDAAMPDILAEYKPGYILGHAPAPPRTMQQNPSYADVIEDIYAFFAGRIEALVKAGLPEGNIVLDVGIGFGKSLEHNFELLRRMERFHDLGRPICLGLSRKRLIGDFLGLERGQARDAATQVLTALLAARGVQIHRVHAVKGAVEALKLAQIISPYCNS